MVATRWSFLLPSVFAVGVIALSGGCSERESSVNMTAHRAPDLTDPMDILQRVDDATKAVKTVKYTGSVHGEGAAASRMSRIEGTVILADWDNGMPSKFWSDVSGERRGTGEKFEITVGGDGENFYVTDHPNKIAYEDIDPTVLGNTGGVAQELWMLEFLHPTPFSDELNGDSQTLVGTKTIAGEECYEIRVEYAGGQGEAFWCFSKNDFLPRQRTDILRSRDGAAASRVRTITSLTVDPKIDASTFRLKLPYGYTKSDDFAP